MTFDLAALVRLIARSTSGHPGHDQGIAAEIDDAHTYLNEGISASARLAMVRAATVSLLIDRNERHGSFADFERAVYTAGELVGLPRPQEIHGVSRAELAAAVDDDHRCNDRSCDTCEAATNGWTHVAAALLVGATEAERTADVLQRWGLP